MYTEEQIDAIGLMLEEKGLSHSQIDDYFEHHGVKGMKWGIRQGRKKTGITRTRGANIDRNNRQIYRRQNALDGSSYQRSMKVGRAFVKGTSKIHGLLGYRGVGTLDNQLKISIKDLQQQNKRLESGKLFMSDRNELINTTSLAALVVSRRPTRMPDARGNDFPNVKKK